MKRIAFLLLASAALAQADWAIYRSGPLEVISNADDKTVRLVLATLDQEKWLAGQFLAKPDIAPLWPVRIVVVKKERGAEVYRTPRVELRRDSYGAGLVEGDPLPREWQTDFARILLNDAIGPLPPSIENGLVELLSNVQAAANRITIQVPPAPRRTRNWARIHMLASDGGVRMRVFLQNLQQSAPIDTEIGRAHV